MHPVVRSCLASVPRFSVQNPRRASRHRISIQQLSQPHRGFHSSPPTRASEGRDGKPDGASENSSSRHDADPLREEEHGLPGEDCTALSVAPLKDLAHYGSAARRSKRSKGQQVVTPSVRVPQWFIDNNVRTLEETARSTIGFLSWDKERCEYVGAEEPMRSSPSDAASAEPSESLDSLVTSKAAGARYDTPYYVDALQWTELVSTTQGLLKLTNQPMADDVASRKNNLTLHYAGDGGVYLLDELIQRLGSELRADVVLLDALDIADLACEPHNSSLSDDAADDRRLLSYDVYHKEDGPANDLRREEEQEQASEVDEQEGEEDHGASPRPTWSTIFLDVRGATSDIYNNDLSRGRKGPGQGPLGQMGPMMQNIGPFSSGKLNKDAESANTAHQRLLPLIEALLAGPLLKRATKRNSVEGENSNVASTTVPVEQIESPLILAIRDAKLLQRTSFGIKFLRVLHQHIESRRRRGQKVIIIGTDNSKADVYSAESIRSLQSEPAGNMSRAMVLTPVLPSKEARLVLRMDQKKRTKVINMRHVWQMLCIKVPGLYEDNQSRQEWASVMGRLSSGAPYCLELVEADRQLWTFDYVHRLATMLVGHMDLDHQASIKDCLERACMSSMRSDKAKFAWVEQQKANRTKSKPDIERAENERLDKLRKRLNRYEKKLVAGVIEPHKITTTFDQVYAPVDTIEALKTLTTLSLVRPDAFKYGVLANDKIPGLLLYGPPGTGKTLLAKAVAKESGATVLEVSGAELNDMYVGEGEKNVKALFSLAKKLTPCVVFIDEADAVFSARGGGQRRVSHRELLNQFLREWDGMSNDAGSAFIMVATNRPFDLDDAVLRRLPRRLLVDLPSESDRTEILKIHLRDESLADDVNLASLAAKTPFYSGSDLKNLGVAAALNCVREENEKAKNHTGEDAFEHAERRTLTADHFDKALQEISASISEDMSSLKAIKKFDEQFGDSRGKKKSPKWGFGTSSEADKQLDTVKVRG